jgi:DNA-binding NarL/FixJ family response regulator
VGTIDHFAVIFVGDHLQPDPQAAIVLSTGSTDPGAGLTELVQVGGRSFVLHSSPASHLIDALRCVAAGGDYVDPALAALLSADADMSRLVQLSPREHQILGLLSEGLTGQAIALLLFLSPETVRTHVRNATTKLGAKTRVQAVALFVRSRGAGTAPLPATG